MRDTTITQPADVADVIGRLETIDEVMAHDRIVDGLATYGLRLLALALVRRAESTFDGNPEARAVAANNGITPARMVAEAIAVATR